VVQATAWLWCGVVSSASAAPCLTTVVRHIMMKRFVIIITVLILGLAGCQTAQERVQAPSTQHDLGDARRLALAWLALVDQEQYSEAFDQYNDAAKQRVRSKESSIAFYQAIRQPHGRPVGRRISREAHVTEFPMLPPSEYAVFDFSTDFPAQKDVFEEVLTEYRGGNWTIAGYACHK
jgi:Protein of unknown function (DUF4019)